MRKHPLVPIVAAVLAASLGCGKREAPESEGKELSRNPVAAVAQLQEAARKAAEAAKEAQGKAPVDPVPFSRLIELLPGAPAGFSAEEPTGESSNAMGFKVSQARRTYRAEGKRLSVALLDGAFNAPLYAGVTMLAQFARESTGGYERGVTLDGNPGVERWRKESGRSELTVVVGKRFLVTIESDGAGEGFPRQVWGRLDRARLAALK